MAAASATSVLLIREGDIDHNRACGAVETEEGRLSVVAIRKLLADRRILIFAAAAVLFHFANAAMLPLVEKTHTGNEPGASALMSACIIAAQAVMVPVAVLASRFGRVVGAKARLSHRVGRAPIRGFLYTLTINPYLLVGIQLLDGVGAGIFGVVSVLVVADLTWAGDSTSRKEPWLLPRSLGRR